MKGAIITACAINVIEAAEMIYEYLYSDDEITIGQIYDANHYRTFVSLLVESTMNRIPLYEVCKKKPVKSRDVLNAVNAILSRMRGCDAEREYLMDLITEVLNRLSSVLSDHPSSFAPRSFLSIVR